MAMDKKFEKELTKALTHLRVELLELNFPGGKDQARVVLQSLNYLTGGDKQLDDLLKLYFELRVRIKLGHDFDTLYRHVILNYRRLVHEKNGGLVIAYIISNVKDSFAKVQSIDDANALVHFVRTLREKKVEVVAEDDTDFGLVVDKPIIVRGTFGAKEYLQNLRSTKGEDLRWQKTNTLFAKGINGNIDEYEGYDDQGAKYTTIYINILGNESTKKVPNGLVLVR